MQMIDLSKMVKHGQKAYLADTLYGFKLFSTTLRITVFTVFVNPAEF
jgi:hypothetical protein